MNAVEEGKSREEEFVKLSIPNVPTSMLNDLAYLMAKISGKDVRAIKDPEMMRFSISISTILLKGISNAMDTIQKKEPSVFRKIGGTIDQLLSGSWFENTTLKQAQRLARQRWIEKQEKETSARTFGMLFEVLRSMKSSDFQDLVDRMEVDLSAVPVKSDERGKYTR